jgi:hypothetical protein
MSPSRVLRTSKLTTNSVVVGCWFLLDTSIFCRGRKQTQARDNATVRSQARLLGRQTGCGAGMQHAVNRAGTGCSNWITLSTSASRLSDQLSSAQHVQTCVQPLPAHLCPLHTQGPPLVAKLHPVGRQQSREHRHSSVLSLLLRWLCALWSNQTLACVHCGQGFCMGVAHTCPSA